MRGSLDHERLDFDVDTAGTIWVRGRTYKASFGAGHATYIPYFGSRAPRNYPLELTLSAVTVGGETLAFDADAPAVRNGDTIEFECDIVNDTNSTFVGQNEAKDDEMCIMVGDSAGAQVPGRCTASNLPGTN